MSVIKIYRDLTLNVFQVESPKNQVMDLKSIFYKFTTDVTGLTKDLFNFTLF